MDAVQAIALQAGLLLGALQVRRVFKSANILITEDHTLNSYFSALGEENIAIHLQREVSKRFQGKEIKKSRKTFGFKESAFSRDPLGTMVVESGLAFQPLYR